MDSDIEGHSERTERTESLEHGEDNAENDQKHIKVGNYDVSIDSKKLPLMGVIGSAIILIIAIELRKNEQHKKYRGYGVALATIALILAFMRLLPNEQLDMYSLYLNYLLFIWCFIGACIMTNGDGPFGTTGNGYFASWSLVVFSAMSIGLGNFSREVRETTTEMNLMIGLAACAVVATISLFPYFDNWDFQQHGESTFFILVCIVTIVYALVVINAKRKNIVSVNASEFSILAALTFFWTIGASLVTFKGPFLVTGNGYFASWIGVVLAVKATVRAKNGDD